MRKKIKLAAKLLYFLVVAWFAVLLANSLQEYGWNSTWANMAALIWTLIFITAAAAITR